MSDMITIFSGGTAVLPGRGPTQCDVVTQGGTIVALGAFDAGVAPVRRIGRESRKPRVMAWLAARRDRPGVGQRITDRLVSHSR